MKWKKLGKIFDPTEFKLPNNCVDYAQSPQALIFDDFVRIYFSTREKDKNGKYLSHIAYADYDKDFKKIRDISKDEVIPLGELGCFDEHGIFPMNVIKVKDKVFAYTTGWNRRISVSADASIGLAISEDNGLHFKKFGSGPVLTASLTEPFLVCDAFVSIFEDKYHMWYIYGTKWIIDPKDNSSQRVYKIAYASSNDGIAWDRDSKQIISDKLNEDECQALPTVIYFNNKYHMFFCFREAIGFREIRDRGYRIGYAFSDDFRNWTRNDQGVGIHVSNDGWDSDMLCYPHVFLCDGRIYMLYNGNEFGRLGFGLAVLEN
jgi:sucrose-6-phosphate hydrolase SacC (GH32 family)